jgi:hypothetical protein
VNLPGLSISTADSSTPGLQWDIAGNQLIFEEINIEFMVDEDLSNWLEIYNWLHAIADPKSGQSGGSIFDQVTEMQLFVYSNSNNLNKIFRFNDLYPTSLSSISFSTQSQAEVLTATVSCNYTTYEVEGV